MMKTAVAALLLSLGVSCAAASVPKLFLRDACRWHDCNLQLNVTSWEFQLRVVEDVTRPRVEWEGIVENILKGPVEQRLPDFRMHRHSRRTMVWHEVERAISTPDGKPLDPAAAAAGVLYPWKQIGVLRLRRCLAVAAAETTAAAPPQVEANSPRHLLKPGESDLGLKLKAVDPAAPPEYDAGFKPKVGGAHLVVKLENDVHCSYQRNSYSAIYRRARGLEVEVLQRLANVRHYFPSLPEVLHLPAAYELPVSLDHFQSKTYWDVEFAGAPGTVQLYLNSPDKGSAVSGSASRVWELSLRVMRQNAGHRLQQVLDSVAAVAEVLGQNGFDAAAPGLLPSSGIM